MHRKVSSNRWATSSTTSSTSSAGTTRRASRRLRRLPSTTPRPTRGRHAAAMPDPRNHLGAIETGGKIYAIGGQHDLNEDTGNDSQVDAFDVVAGTWSAVASLPMQLSHVHNATFVSGGNVITVGGSTTGEAAVADVLAYDPANNRWRTLGQLP